MIRSTRAARLLLWGALVAPSLAIGQEAPKANPPAAETISANDPFLAYYQYYHPALWNQVGAHVSDPLELNFGLRLSDADEALRAQLEIAPGEGVVVDGVKAGSLAEQAGLKLNDVLLRLGDHEVKTQGQARQVLLGLGKEALEVKLIREGKPSRMSLVGPEHGFPAEASEYWIGTPVSRVDATLRTHLPALPADAGLIVNDVVKDSPADRIAVKKNDILVAMDGKPLANPDALIAQIQATQGKPVPLNILRAGKPITLTITPAKRAHPTVINVRKNPNQVRWQVVRPNMAIEVEPNSVQLQATPIRAKPVASDARAAPSGGVAQTTPYTAVLVDPYGRPKPQYDPQVFDFDVNSLNQNGIASYLYLNSSNRPQIIPDQTTYPNISTTVPRQSFFINQPQVVPDPATARIEEQLKEVLAKLEVVTKALEAIKQSAGK